MFEIWKKCQELEWEQKNLERLEKQILSRSLFTEQVSFSYFEVFASYYERSILEKDSEKLNLVWAFLSYEAYRYVVHKEKIDCRIFDILPYILDFSAALSANFGRARGVGDFLP